MEELKLAADSQFSIPENLSEEQLEAEWFIHTLAYSDTSPYKEETLEHIWNAFNNIFENDSQKKALADNLASSPILSFQVDNNVLVQINFVTRKVHILSEYKPWNNEILISEMVENNINIILQTMSTILENAQNVNLMQKQELNPGDIKSNIEQLLSKERADIVDFLEKLSLHISDNCLKLDIDLWTSKVPIGIIHKFMCIVLTSSNRPYLPDELYSYMNSKSEVWKLFDIETKITKISPQDWQELTKYKFGEAFVKSLLTYESTTKILTDFLNTK